MLLDHVAEGLDTGLISRGRAVFVEFQDEVWFVAAYVFKISNILK